MNITKEQFSSLGHFFVPMLVINLTNVVHLTNVVQQSNVVHLTKTIFVPTYERRM